jgi:hypothetical protein
VSTYQWLLVFHVTGAFLLLGGARGVGFIVSDAGANLLIMVRILLGVPQERVMLAVPVLTALYLVALRVAWAAMSGKLSGQLSARGNDKGRHAGRATAATVVVDDRVAVGGARTH